MGRLRSVVAALGVLAVLSLVGPVSVAACSCAGIATMSDVKGTDAAVFIGRVGQDRGTGVFEVAVERWFRGGDAARVAVQSGQTRMPDGSFMFDTCGLVMKPGQHLILAASMANNVYQPAVCSVRANVDTPEGAALVADAQAVFGPGAPPGDDATPEGGSSVSLPFLGVAIVGSALVLLVAAVRLGARRERT